MKIKVRNKKISFSKLISLALFYGVLRYLPSGTNRICGRLCRSLRYHCCKNIFDYCGKNANIERMAFFGSGIDIELGEESGLGINCNVPSNIKIGKNVMMGPNCYIFSSNHEFSRTDIPMIKQGFGEKTNNY